MKKIISTTKSFFALLVGVCLLPLCVFAQPYGPARVKCELCDTTFSRKGNRTRHVREQHAGQTSYQCKVCDKSFRRKAVLDVHVQKHTGKRRHKCDICDTSLYDGSSLYRHRQTRGHKVRMEFQASALLVSLRNAPESGEAAVSLASSSPPVQRPVLAASVSHAPANKVHMVYALPVVPSQLYPSGYALYLIEGG